MVWHRKCQLEARAQKWLRKTLELCCLNFFHKEGGRICMQEGAEGKMPATLSLPLCLRVMMVLSYRDHHDPQTERQ